MAILAFLVPFISSILCTLTQYKIFTPAYLAANNIGASFPRLTFICAIDEPVADKRFPLMRLPSEIRRRVYQQYFHRLVWFPFKIIVPYKKRVWCGCLPLERKICRQLSIDLAFTSKAVKDEVLAAFMELHTFHFGCGCELSELHSALCSGSS